MEKTTSKEKILKEVRKSQLNKVDNSLAVALSNKPHLKDLEESIDLHFAKELSGVDGKFVFCENEAEMAEVIAMLVKKENIDPIFCKNQEIQEHLTAVGLEFFADPAELKNCKTGITECEFLVARYGAVLMSSALSSGRKLYSWPEIHIVVAYASQLVPELNDAIIGMRERYNGILPSMVSLITGPSRTADIEKTLVNGIHGPRDLFVFYIDDLMD